MKKAGLILEGGGTRGVFTAGVLDYLMEKELYLPYVIGVSAGSCNALNYVAHQKGRTKECMIDYLKEGSYVVLKYLVQKHSLFDMDLLFDVFPNSEIPFDYETYYESKQRCVIAATSCMSGRAVYITEKSNSKRLMTACRASSSLPLIAPIVWLDGIPMLDGGIGDSIPIRKALLDGIKKNIIVLTRAEGYRKPRSNRKERIVRMAYQKKYPEFVKSYCSRARRYNKTMELIEKLEKCGHVLVIRPEPPLIKSTENNPEVLLKFYSQGYEKAKKMYSEIQQFLGISDTTQL